MLLAASSYQREILIFLPKDAVNKGTFGKYFSKEKNMYSLLVRLMILSALLQFGLSLSDISDCRTGKCLKIEKASRRILHIDWRPISVFPDEARRFRGIKIIK